MEKQERQAKKKCLSPKLQLRRVAFLIPVEIDSWLREIANKEGKSLSLVLTEILQEAKSKGVKNKG